MVTKIIKTHSVQNGHTKKTLTFSTEENNLSNETQALPFNQSPAFYSSNAPVMYSWWTDVKDWVEGAANDTGKWIEGAANDVAAGFEDFGRDIGIAYSSKSTDIPVDHHYYRECSINCVKPKKLYYNEYKK